MATPAWDSLRARRMLDRLLPDTPVPPTDRRSTWARTVVASVANRSFSEAAAHLGVSRRVVVPWLAEACAVLGVAVPTSATPAAPEEPATAPRAADAPWLSTAGRRLLREHAPDASAPEAQEPAWRRLVVAALERAPSMDAAALALGVGRRTMFRWKGFLQTTAAVRETAPDEEAHPEGALFE